MNEAVVSVTFPPSVLHPRGSQQYFKMAGLNAYRLGLNKNGSLLKPGSQELKWWQAGWEHGKKTNPIRFITAPLPQRKPKKLVIPLPLYLAACFLYGRRITNIEKETHAN